MLNNYNTTAHDGSGRMTSLRVVYKTVLGTTFKVDGDETRFLEIEGRKDYVLDWIREKLRKMENGQIKVVKYSSGERDWKQEEKIKKQLWEDINVNEYPEGLSFNDIEYLQDSRIICTWPQQSVTQYKR